MGYVSPVSEADGDNSDEEVITIDAKLPSVPKWQIEMRHQEDGSRVLYRYNNLCTVRTLNLRDGTMDLTPVEGKDRTDFRACNNWDVMTIAEAEEGVVEFTKWQEQMTKALGKAPRKTQVARAEEGVSALVRRNWTEACVGETATFFSEINAYRASLCWPAVSLLTPQFRW
jgi:hypothetical protein